MFRLPTVYRRSATASGPRSRSESDMRRFVTLENPPFNTSFGSGLVDLDDGSRSNRDALHTSDPIFTLTTTEGSVMDKEEQGHDDETRVAQGEEFLLEMRIRETLDRLTTPEAKRNAVAALKEVVHSLESDLEKDEGV